MLISLSLASIGLLLGARWARGFLRFTSSSSSPLSPAAKIGSILGIPLTVGVLGLLFGQASSFVHNNGLDIITHHEVYDVRTVQLVPLKDAGYAPHYKVEVGTKEYGLKVVQTNGGYYFFSKEKGQLKRWGDYAESMVSLPCDNPTRTGTADIEWDKDIYVSQPSGNAWKWRLYSWPNTTASRSEGKPYLARVTIWQ
jgi:hypothetical protein